MTEERYKQIKDSIELQSLVKKQMGVEDELLQEEIELLKAYEKLQQENQELKKQLENCFCNRTDCAGRIKGSKTYYSLEQTIETQQKEFIEYLKHQVKLQEELNDIHLATGFEEILQKYKSIIGGNDV